MHFCPYHLLALGKNVNLAGYAVVEMTNKDKCSGCTVCALMCPECAIEVFR